MEAPLLYRALPEHLELEQIRSSTDQWWLAHVADRSCPGQGEDPQRLVFAFDLDQARFAKEEGGLGGGCRSLSYHDLARSSRLLQACRDVHRISRHQEITSRRVAGGHDFTGVDTPPQQQAFSKERVSGDGLAQCQGGSQRALRVIAVRAWQAEDRHHRVADKLLEGASSIGNDALGVGVVAAHQGAHIFGVQALAQCGRAGHVGKQDGHELSHFGHKCTSAATMARKTTLWLATG
jgi:hypothetical protein